jgi:uncharacterized protein (DUF58 family)
MTAATAFTLNDQAERASRALPPLLVEAQRITATVILGVHGRKRAGPGESFWQYRPYSYGDSISRVDWHKSARSDRVFIRENEWEAANTLWLWASPSPSMNFKSHLSNVSKRDRADLITLALASLALRAQERVGLIGAPDAPGHSRAVLMRMAQRILQHEGAALPAFIRSPRFASAVLCGDFFDTPAAIATAISPMAETGIAGHLVQIVDPAEETLPWSGRVEFHEMTGPLRFLSGKTETLRDAYVDKLRLHREALRALCNRLGWSFTIHRTDQAPTHLLMHLHGLIGGGRSRNLVAGSRA